MGNEPTVRLYDAQYGQFASELYSAVRQQAFGEDIGQNGWLTADEHDLFISWLGVVPDSRVLDIATGSGGPDLRIALTAGCAVTGVDLHEQGVAAATDSARRLGLEHRVDFRTADASQRLPFDDAAFDALICTDAINHLRDRSGVLAEWARVLRPGGRLVFTDPVVITGPLTNEELAIRSSIGFFLFVPRGYDEQLLSNAGFEVTETSDRTENMAVTARRWREARESFSSELLDVEGPETFHGQQEFLAVTSTLAAERRLSRYAFRAVKR